jgi:outer membrane lipoprotein LolB
MKQWIVLLIAVAGLSGCAHLPVGGDGLSFAERRMRLEALDAWEMRGRLAVDTGERGGFQGSFRWQQEADALSLLVRGPFGAGILKVAGSPDALTVTARGDTWRLTDPEAELSALLGWWMPVGSLHAWLIGIPDRGFRARTDVGEDGVVKSLQQRLWQLDYVAYQLSDGVLVPRRIDMSHGSLRLRLTVDSWQAPDTVPAS